tara:strand:+ start:416 stop:784 length:369 start_codon:yes stop_codon:yes gene_type:complete
LNDNTFGTSPSSPSVDPGAYRQHGQAAIPQGQESLDIGCPIQEQKNRWLVTERSGANEEHVAVEDALSLKPPAFYPKNIVLRSHLPTHSDPLVWRSATAQRPARLNASLDRQEHRSPGLVET